MKGRTSRSLLRFRHNSVLLLLGVALVISMTAALGIGSTRIPAASVAKIILFKILNMDAGFPGYYGDVIIGIRLPRIIMGAITGAVLGIAGCGMQGLFRNPMASPYVVGIASSSAFGASLVIILGLGSAWTGPSAFLFSVFCAFLVYRLSRIGGTVPVGTLLLAGIAVSIFFSALVSFTQYLAGERELRRIVFWLMGGLWESDWKKVFAALPTAVLGSAGLMCFSRDLNIMLTGEEQAGNLGVDVENVRRMVLVLSSLVTATAVSSCGIIGFVGLIIPHVMRILVGPDHGLLMPASMIGGAIFLVWTDTLARVVIAPSELPVGIITAILGVPFFLALLRGRKKQTGL